LLLPLGEARVGQDCQLDRAHPIGVGVGIDDPGPDVELFGGDAQRPSQLLEHLGRRPAEPALDLAEVRVAHANLVCELPQREPRRETLLLEVVTQRTDRAESTELVALVLGHTSSMLTAVSKMQTKAA